MAEPGIGWLPAGGRRYDRLLATTIAGLAGLLQANEGLLHDGGISIAQLQAAGAARFVVRLGTNRTARRAYLPAFKGRG